MITSSNLVCSKCIKANNGKRQRVDLFLPCYSGHCNVCGQEAVLVECNFFGLERDKMGPHFVKNPHQEVKGQYDGEIESLRESIAKLMEQIEQIKETKKSNAFLANGKKDSK